MVVITYLILQTNSIIILRNLVDYSKCDITKIRWMRKETGTEVFVAMRRQGLNQIKLA